MTTTLLTLDDSLAGISATKPTAKLIAQVRAARQAGQAVNMKLAVRTGKVVDYCFFDPHALLALHDGFTNSNGETRWQVAGNWDL